MSTSPIAALEIGTARTVVLVGEMDEEGRLTVRGKGIAPSFGIRKGQVTDAQNARRGVDAALKQAADQSQTDIGTVVLAIGGGHVRSSISIGTASVADRNHIVSEEDAEEATENAKAVPLEPDRKIIHTIPQIFSLDNLAKVSRPVGLQGHQLQLSMLIVDGKESGIENLRNVAMDARVDVDDYAFSGLCASLSVLSFEQKKGGAVVIDLGAGTTDYFVYADSATALAGSIAIGGEHVTNDLSIAFNIEHRQAEALKLQYGRAAMAPGVGLKRIPLPAGLGRDGQSISMRSFQTVINARMDETLRLVRAELNKGQFLQRVSTGVVFTGGGAAMEGLCELGESIFGVPCFIGDPRENVRGLEDVTDVTSYATAAGLLLYGMKRHREPGFMEAIRNRFGRFFG